MIPRKLTSQHPSWPIRLGVALLGMAILPAAARPAGAQEPDAKPQANRLQIEERDGIQVVDPILPPRTIIESVEVPKVDADRTTRDLERKLRELEVKLDRLLDETRATASDRERMPTVDRSPFELDEDETPGRGRIRVEVRRHETGQASKVDDPDKPRVEVEIGSDAGLEDEIETLIGKAVDPDRLKRLESEFDNLVEQGIDAERMERFGHELGALVEETFDPERMERLGNEVEALLEKTFDPERLERYTREIESAVRRRLREHAPRAEAEIEAYRRSEEARARDEAIRSRDEETEARARESGREMRARDLLELRERANRERSDRSDPETEALDRRLRELEERLDRVLRSLEGNDKPDSR